MTKRALLIAASLAATSGCAHQDDWTRQDTIRQSVYTGLLLVDAIQTSDIQNHQHITERRSMAREVLGPNPSTEDTAVYFATLAISHGLISRALPAKWRPYWQGFGILDLGTAVISNCDLGLGPCN